jgi:cell division protein FtsB
VDKQVKPPLKEAFAGLVYDMFRASGLAMTTSNQEKLEAMAPRFADALKREAHTASLVLAKRLQQATLEGFQNFSAELDNLKVEIEGLKNEIQRLTAENAAHDRHAQGDGK